MFVSIHPQFCCVGVMYSAHLDNNLGVLLSNKPKDVVTTLHGLLDILYVSVLILSPS